MADIKAKYGTAGTFTTTNLQSLASSSTRVNGWTSAYLDNTSTLAIDYLVGGQFTVAAAGLSASTVIEVYAYASYDGTNSPDLFSSGTEGTEGAANVHDTEQRDCGMVLLWSGTIDTGASEVYSMPPRSIRQAFGFVPRKVALWVTHNTGAALASSGNALYYDPVFEQTV